jgi:hypothetical protein
MIKFLTGDKFMYKNIPMFNVGASVRIGKQNLDDSITWINSDSIMALVTEYGMGKIKDLPICDMSNVAFMYSEDEDISYLRKFVGAQINNVLEGDEFLEDDLGKYVVYPDGTKSRIVSATDTNKAIVDRLRNIPFTTMYVMDIANSEKPSSTIVDSVEYINTITPNSSEFDETSKLVTLKSTRILKMETVPSTIDINALCFSHDDSQYVFGKVKFPSINFVAGETPVIEITLERSYYCGEWDVNNVNVENITCGGVLKFNNEFFKDNTDYYSQIDVNGDTVYPIKSNYFERCDTVIDTETQPKYLNLVLQDNEHIPEEWDKLEDVEEIPIDTINNTNLCKHLDGYLLYTLNTLETSKSILRFTKNNWSFNCTYPILNIEITTDNFVIVTTTQSIVLFKYDVAITYVDYLFYSNLYTSIGESLDEDVIIAKSIEIYEQNSFVFFTNVNNNIFKIGYSDTTLTIIDNNVYNPNSLPIDITTQNNTTKIAIKFMDDSIQIIDDIFSTSEELAEIQDTQYSNSINFNNTGYITKPNLLSYNKTYAMLIMIPQSLEESSLIGGLSASYSYDNIVIDEDSGNLRLWWRGGSDDYRTQILYNIPPEDYGQWRWIVFRKNYDSQYLKISSKNFEHTVDLSSSYPITKQTSAITIGMSNISGYSGNGTSNINFAYFAEFNRVLSNSETDKILNGFGDLTSADCFYDFTKYIEDDNILDYSSNSNDGTVFNLLFTSLIPNDVLIKSNIYKSMVITDDNKLISAERNLLKLYIYRNSSDHEFINQLIIDNTDNPKIINLHNNRFLLLDNKGVYSVKFGEFDVINIDVLDEVNEPILDAYYNNDKLVLIDVNNLLKMFYYYKYEIINSACGSDYIDTEYNQDLCNLKAYDDLILKLSLIAVTNSDNEILYKVNLNNLVESFNQFLYNFKITTKWGRIIYE